MPPDGPRPPALPRVLVGTDIVRVAEVAEAIERQGERYLARLFTEGERATVGDPLAPGAAPRLAARFAAKEAAIKVFGLVDGIDHRSMEVLTHPDGRPELLLRGQAAAHAAKLGLTSHSLSLAHEAEYAVAVVVALVAP
jgi:holo-[acyl-carrier protein] synthase